MNKQPAQPETSRSIVESESKIVARLSVLDRYLPVWILAAMGLGLLLGRAFPGLNDALDSAKIDTVSLPIAFGLLAMMYPVLAKVNYSRVGEVTADRRMLGASLLLNWIVGPLVMFTLAWIFLPDLPAYRTGLIIVGLARCIAMVLIWNDLACGNGEVAAVLVALNSLFQVFAYALLGWFYLQALPEWLGLSRGTVLGTTMWAIAKIVLIFLGIPLLAGYLTRLWGVRLKGTVWYETEFIPRISPFALYGLLFTIVVMFALQGDKITALPFDVVRIAIPLLSYFGIMWGISFLVGYRMRFAYGKNTAVAFTAAGNNFELAIAVAIGVFGISSGEALATVVGPLIEVPALVGLVYLALWAKRRFYTPAGLPSISPTPRPSKPAVLFLCVHNAGRSQMAAGWLRHIAGGAVDVYSGGSEPAIKVNAMAVKAMTEVGIDIGAESPKPWTTKTVAEADVVVTMGCGDACPVFPGKRYEDWQLTDPAGQPIEVVREVRDEIERRVRALLASLHSPTLS